MNKIIFLMAMLTSAGLIMSAIDTSLEAAIAQTNTTNATAGGTAGNTTAGGTAGNTTAGNTTDVGTASELEQLTGSNADVMGNNTEVANQSTGMAGLEREQTTDTGGKMTEGDKGTYEKEQGEGVQQPK
jgi:hypothetical protein